MTEQEKQQLSHDVAAKYGIVATSTEFWVANSDTWHNEVWLHEDSARCFDLMVEHGIEVAYTKHVAVVRFELTQVIQAPYNQYESKQEATRIAILKALLAKGE